MASDFRGLFSLLESQGIRYVLVGGLAALLHGVDRVTAGVDLAIDLAPAAVRDAVTVLTQSGYRATAPVDPQLLADPAIRSAWHRERGMQVFSFWDSTHTRPTIDIFVEPPIAFEDLWQASVVVRIGGDSNVRIASIAHLIELKLRAGRPQDLADIERLRQIESRGQPRRVHRRRQPRLPPGAVGKTPKPCAGGLSCSGPRNSACSG